MTLCGRLTFLQVSLRSKDPWEHPSSLPRGFPSAMQLQQGRGWVWPFPEHSQQVFPSFLFWSPWHLTFFMLHRDKTSYLLSSQMRKNRLKWYQARKCLWCLAQVPGGDQPALLALCCVLSGEWRMFQLPGLSVSCCSTKWLKSLLIITYILAITWLITPCRSKVRSS